jgi:hypothetical protein
VIRAVFGLERGRRPLLLHTATALDLDLSHDVGDLGDVAPVCIDQPGFHAGKWPANAPLLRPR